MDSRRHLQGILEYLTAHICIDDRVPVLKLDRAGSQRLRKLIHCSRGLLACRAGDCREVCNALDCIDRCIQLNTGSCKRTDVARHFREVINGQIRVFVQLVQSAVDVVDVGSLFLCVRQNRLRCIDLCLIFLQAGCDRFNRQS